MMGNVRICKPIACIVVCVGRLVRCTNVALQGRVFVKKEWVGLVIRGPQEPLMLAFASAAFRVASKADGRLVSAKSCLLQKSHKINKTTIATAKSTRVRREQRSPLLGRFADRSRPEIGFFQRPLHPSTKR